MSIIRNNITTNNMYNAKANQRQDFVHFNIGKYKVQISLMLKSLLCSRVVQFQIYQLYVNSANKTRLQQNTFVGPGRGHVNYGFLQVPSQLFDSSPD